jgi:hypothetical protein
MVRTYSPTIGSTGIGPNTLSGKDAIGKPTESSGLRPKHADVARMLHSRDPDARVLDWSSAPLACLRALDRERETLADTTRSAGGRLLLLGKRAVLADLLASPFAAESDEDRQRDSACTNASRPER